MNASLKKLSPIGRELRADGIQHLSDDHVILVSFAMTAQPGGSGPEVQLGKQQGLVGIDDRTGKVLWKSVGSDLLCLTDDLRRSGHPVRCHWDIGARLKTTQQGMSSRKLNVDLEGFDPRTGKRTWSTALAPGSGLLAGGAQVGLLADGTAAMNGPKGQVVVSLTDGHVRAASSKTPRLCRHPVSGATGHSVKTADRRTDRFVLSRSFQWCDGKGAAVAAKRPWPSSIGAQVKDIRVVLTADGLQGFDQPAG